MKFQIASPMPSKLLRSFTLLLFTCFPWMYLAKKLSKTLIFLASKVKCSIEPCKEIGWNEPLQSSSSVGAWGLYGSWMLMTSSSCEVLTWVTLLLELDRGFSLRTCWGFGLGTMRLSYWGLMSFWGSAALLTQIALSCLSS